MIQEKIIFKSNSPRFSAKNICGKKQNFGIEKKLHKDIENAYIFVRTYFFLKNVSIIATKNIVLDGIRTHNLEVTRATRYAVGHRGRTIEHGTIPIYAELCGTVYVAKVCSIRPCQD